MVYNNYLSHLHTHTHTHTHTITIVNFPLVISQDMTLLNVTTGEDVDISFNNSWNMNRPSFHWQKNGANISSGNKYKGTNTDTLTILNTQKTDEGTYILVNRYENITSESFYINLSIGKSTLLLWSRKYSYARILHINMQLMLPSQLKLQPNRLSEFIMS